MADAACRLHRVQTHQLAGDVLDHFGALSTLTFQITSNSADGQK